MLRRQSFRALYCGTRCSELDGSDPSALSLAPRAAQNRRSWHHGSTGPGAFNAHSPGSGGSGFSPYVFRSPPRIPTLGPSPERSARRTAKRKTLYILLLTILLLTSRQLGWHSYCTEPRPMAAG
jgi:hypothetical protein